MQESASNQQIRFLLPTAGVRGVAVELGSVWQEIHAHAEYPDRALSLLGQACASAALFTGHAKVDGRLSLQLRSQGVLRTLFAECTATGTLRGIVRLADESEGAKDAPSDLRQLGDGAMLAITVENPGLDPQEPQRYQSLVSLDAATLDAALESYFVQSEQLPTRLILAADGTRAAGLMLQRLPGDEGSGDGDGWDRACALFNTLRSEELLGTPAQTLLQRLFHEEDAEVLAERPLAFACSCSRDRVSAMLQALGLNEARAAVDSDGHAKVHCEFCGQSYIFQGPQVEELFSRETVEVPAPERLQ